MTGGRGPAQARAPGPPAPGLTAGARPPLPARPPGVTSAPSPPLPV